MQSLEEMLKFYVICGFGRKVSKSFPCGCHGDGPVQQAIYAVLYVISIFHIVIRDEISTLFKAFNEKDWIFQCYSAFRYFNELMRH